MFDFKNANDAQRQAISSVEGPLLITAGPGTGKTFTLVQRAIYLIQERGVKPEQIFIATFTEKAAKELVTRITNELASRDISINVNDMYVGTFHSLCLRILKEHLEYTKFKKNYRMLDSFDQEYTVFQKIHKFKNIPDIELLFDNTGSWRMAQAICGYVNNLSEELVDVDELMKDKDTSVAVMGQILKIYKDMLYDGNLIDFASIQTECYNLLTEHEEILAEIQDKLRYFMIDEYQDTNYIQEQLVFLLGSRESNICVVGDDDQGLYRFRGATIRNILEFPQKFPAGVCKIVSLVVNYRSDSDIINFYNDWMHTTDWGKGHFSWDKYRYDKKILPYKESEISSSCAVTLSGDGEDDWHEQVLGFIQGLKEAGKLTDYNQLAFLFSSVKNDKAVALAEFLEKNGINVYSPRSDMFFKRREIMLALGFMMLMFPNYFKKLENDEFEFLKPKQRLYYMDCCIKAAMLLKLPENKDLKKFIAITGKNHFALKRGLDYAYTGLLYKLFMFQPFIDMLDVDMSVGVVDIRPTRNLAQLTKIIAKYEYLHGIDVLSPKNIEDGTEKFFNLYMRLLMEGGINEYEDDSEYAPSGCVSFLTIHQSKGMEFPIVFVDSLSSYPRSRHNDLIQKIEERYFHRPAYEPYELMKYFDFWRLYYTAFSRAQNLLILTCAKSSRTPSPHFRESYNSLPKVDGPYFDMDAFEFSKVKNVNIKDKFSFTSHISVYETCPMQYKFYKELEFTPVRAGAMIFGTLVHETIEDIHRAAIRHEEHLINKENIEKWFNANYDSITKKEHSYLAEPQQKAALNQVQAYADRQNGSWNHIQEAEVDVSLVRPDYIIEGKIDLVKGDNGTVELIDFKSEKKPDIDRNRERIEHYRRQLHIYAYLLENRTGQKISKMHLYYTGETDGSPYLTFPYTKSAIEGTMASFDVTVHKILKKDYGHRCYNPKTCQNCDFRFYCGTK